MPDSQRPGEERLALRPRGWARAAHLLHDAQWWIIGGAAVTAAVLGFIGFDQYQSATDAQAAGFWDVSYRTLQLFTLESGALAEGDAVPASLNVARFLAPLVMAGALIRATLGLFREQAQLVRMRMLRDHVVVCGVGRKGSALARSLRREGYPVVAIEQDAESDLVAPCRSAGVPVLIGDATDPVALVKAGILRARYLVALCGQSGTNAQVATVVHQLSDRYARPITCLAHVVEPELCALLRTRFPVSSGDSAFRLEFFDTYERGARVMLQRYPPFAQGGHDATSRVPHLLVVGLGRLGRSLVVQAARTWRSGHPRDDRFLLTAVDPDVADRIDVLLGEHPEVGSACDLRAAADHDGPWDPPVTTTYVCLADEAQALLAGLTVRRSRGAERARVVVRAGTDEGLPTLLGGAGGGLTGLHGFALLDQTCDAELLFGGFTDALAQLLHARYVAAREAQGWTYGARRDDARRTHPALVPWPALAPAYRDSNRDQAAHTWAKLAEVGCELVELTDWDAPRFCFTAPEVERLAELEHRRWMRYQQRTTGPRWRSVRDSGRNPDLAPWRDLPEGEKEIDREFVRSLPPLLSQLGYQVVRRSGETVPV